MAENDRAVWLNKLAGEVMNSLTEAREKSLSLSIKVLAETLGQRPAVKELLDEACRPLEAAVSQKEEQAKQLEGKYKAAQDEIRMVETHSEELEDSFKKLIGVLATLAENPKQPDLKQELKNLKNNLKKKAIPSRLESSTRGLKEFVYRGVHGAIDEQESDKKKQGGFFKRLLGGSGEQGVEVREDEAVEVIQPEDVEEDIRDVLVLLVKDLADFEDVEIQKKARLLIRRIASEFTLEEYKPYISDVQNLIIGLKETVHREKRALYDFSREVISSLQETEKDLINTYNTNSKRLGTDEKEFALAVENDIKAIEQTFDLGWTDVDRIRGTVLSKIDSIRKRFKKKQAQDEALLRQMAREKEGAEKRFQDIHKRYKEFTRKSQAMLEEMEKFKKASFSDGLTGVYNRRAYDLQVKTALTELKKGALKAFALIVFDIDHFKEFNNNYGHRAGDKTLYFVAKMSRDGLRKEDFLARYGGDEFAIILPEADLNNAGRVAESIRSGVAEVEFKIYKGKDLTVKIGLSMGVAVGRPEDDPGTIFHRADQALYLAKKKGRNQVCLETELPQS